MINKESNENKWILKDEEPVNQARGQKPATFHAIQGSLPTEPWPVLCPHIDVEVGAETAGLGFMQPRGVSHPSHESRGSLVLIIYLVLMGYWTGNEGPQTTLVFLLHVLPLSSWHSPTKGSYRHHTFVAQVGPTVLVMDPHGAAASGHWMLWKPAIVAVASWSKVHKSKIVLLPVVANWSWATMHLKMK